DEIAARLQIADIRAMKRQIHAHKGFGSITVPGHNVKLGRGGIREIEFFAQTQQLIAGGRQPELRTPETLEALSRLAHRDWIDSPAATELTDDYKALRVLEHRIQMIADEQTQQLPSDDDGLDRIAAFSGFETREAFADDLTARLTRVHGHYAALFERPDRSATQPTVDDGGCDNLIFFGEDDDPSTLQALDDLGFSDPARTVGFFRSWHRGRYRALATARAREDLSSLHRDLVLAFAETVDPDAAVVGFDRLLAALPAGVQFFALLAANANLLRLIANIVGSAPRLSQTLARRRSVIDALVDPRIIGEVLPGPSELDSLVAQELAKAASYEDVLDRARVLGAEQQFLIGVRVLAGSVGAEVAGRAYADLAEALIRNLHRATTNAFEAQNGVVRGWDAAVIAMGKLGGHEMTAASDIDLIVVYGGPDDVRQSSGARPLAPSQYYARLTQRLIAALSAPTSEGGLYQVDMRLRPSGQKGPVATGFASFESYQQNDAWTWEHMALTRARVVSGPPELTEALADVIHRVLTSPRDRAKTARDVRDMRQRVWEEKGGETWHLKQARGGLVDLEFLVQFLQLIHAAEHPNVLSQNTETSLRALNAAGLLGPHGPDLIAACRLFHDLTQVLRLCFDGVFTPEKSPAGLRRFLADVAGEADFARLELRIVEVQQTVADAFEDLVR
ncbi:MAG: bifunctional [glutamine synthetase] adenylyltransferase/[glutamine synthetase]-adenylyl-L-tyrosine phosphorylase, partial [Pseudomonadota bacterium]